MMKWDEGKKVEEKVMKMGLGDCGKGRMSRKWVIFPFGSIME